MTPKVSVILISKNVGEYIRECLQSVIDQTLKDIEILCIDAFSTDGTREVINEFASQDNRVSLYDDTKGSTGFSNNLGIKLSKGKYIAFVETDDFIKSNMIEELYDAAEKYDCDYVKSDYYAFWTTDDGERIFRKRKTFEDENLYNKLVVPREHIEVATGDWYLWKGLYKKSFLIEDNIRFSETKGAAFQDIGFLHQTTSKAERALYLPSYHYCYCVDREGSSSNSSKMMRYAWQEFDRLLSISEEDNNVIDLFYARMAKSFVCCYRGADVHADEDKEDAGIDYKSWFIERLKIGVKDGYLTENSIPSGLWYKLLRVLYGLTHSSLDEVSLVQFIQRKSDADIAIFGCGSYGYDAYRKLSGDGFKIRAFIDNDNVLWGKSVNGVKIDTPDNISDYPADMRIIIANEVYYDEIKEQLLEKGVARERIYIYE